MHHYGLALSGGGFRATLFHLGVIRYMRDAGALEIVSDIASVSGGSILAAHLALNWERYNGTDEEFAEALGREGGGPGDDGGDGDGDGDARRPRYRVVRNNGGGSLIDDGALGGQRSALAELGARSTVVGPRTLRSNANVTMSEVSDYSLPLGAPKAKPSTIDSNIDLQRPGIPKDRI